MDNSIRITYDAEGDTLYINFADSRSARGFELSDQILLRVDPQTFRPLGLTLFNFLYHIKHKDTISLSGFVNMPPAIRKIILTIITSPPIEKFLQMSSHISSSEQQEVMSSSSSPTVSLLQPPLAEAIGLS